MKALTFSCHFPLGKLVTLFLALFVAPPVLAAETLRYAVVSCDNLALLRDDLSDAPADFFVAGQKPVASDGSPRKVHFVGTVSLEGKPQVELGGRLFAPDLGVSERAPYVHLTVKKLTGISPPAFTVNVDLMLMHQRYSSKAGARYTGSSRVPARANAWQEVISWSDGFHSIWQYYTPAEAQTPTEPNTDDKMVPIYRLDVRLGQLSDEALDKLPRYDPEHRRLIAELGRWRESFSTHVSPDVPFQFANSFFDLKKIASDEGHEMSGLNRITGSIEEDPSHFILKLQYQPPAPRKQDLQVRTLGIEMGTDGWFYQRIENPPRAENFVEGTWCDTTWGEKSLGVHCMNVAAYRLTKVSPAPEGNPPRP
ncbi:hypothetical protein [Haloferula sp. BvORR071]|uniref:hypothetical protein n=1 Tax=Haloferula sp. BvORR071 TaxID=1396141 RepID=UPI000556CBDA|nr:hypothetical protein [Haloferula sp. BvORR071]